MKLTLYCISFVCIVQAWPTSDLLDQYFPNNPIYLTRVDGHAGWANSAAMAIADVPGMVPVVLAWRIMSEWHNLVSWGNDSRKIDKQTLNSSFVAIARDRRQGLARNPACDLLENVYGP